MAEIWTKKKKILSRKERFKIPGDDINKKKDKEDNAEQLLTQTEDEILQLQAEEKIKYEKALQEYTSRCEKIKNSCEKFQNLRFEMAEMQNQDRNRNTHQKYPEITNLNRIVPWVNERISKWCSEKIQTNHVKNQINDYIEILNMLTDYIENPLNLQHLEYWSECKRNLRDELYRKLDYVSYTVIKNIEKKMAYLDLDVMFYKECNDYFTNLIWTVLDKPKQGKDDKFPLSSNFGDLGVIVNLPKFFYRKPIVVRCLWTTQDYFSEDCPSHKEKNLPEEHIGDFHQYHKRIWEQEEMLRIKQQEDMNTQLEKEKALNLFNKIKHLIPSTSKENLFSETKPPTEETEKSKDISLKKLVHLKKSPSQKQIDIDRHEIERFKQYFVVDLEKFECNMRKYNIVGGVYHLELIKQPPQPKLLKDGAVLRMIIGADELQRWEYLETYEPPVVKTGTTKQSTDDDDEDAENTPEGKLLSKLVLITMKLPDHVLWFDSPVVVHWDTEKHYWSTEYIYEMKFNEEKQTLSFRAGKMTAFGLAVFKYNNFPYQSWELKPDFRGESPQVIFGLTTSALVLEFIIRRNEVCLTLLENANTMALQQHVGIFYPARILARILKQGGVNIFPSQDACLYVDSMPKKHHIIEDHLHHCMAYLCQCFEFSWSRWNLSAGYKKFILQIRQTKSKNNQLLMVTDEKTIVTECTDVSQSFTDTAISGMKFYPDLLTLAQDYGDEDSKQIMSKVDPIFIETVYYFLSETRVMSFS
ncbi:dynein axonemal intermediate chain 7-like [Planococcus citri]|uniref:dynein axonemal intermediate chain 7-like n=1 Tax=Planococcus citri TaxID=170843 RepID=UPI0031F975D8